MSVISKTAHQFYVDLVANEVVAWGRKTYDDGQIVECELGRAPVADVLAHAAANGQTIPAGPFAGRTAVLWENFFAVLGVTPAGA